MKLNRSENNQIKLSIVIAAWNGVEMLRACLSSLKNQINSNDIEAVVVSNFGDEAFHENAPEFPFARYFVLPAETTVPELRARGITEAKGEIVALSEDLCIFNADWCGEILEAHKNLPYSVIGGAVESVESQGALDWAVYFYDYGKYMLPNRAQTLDALSEINISYKREILERNEKDFASGFWEVFFNESLKRDGHELFLQPSAVVLHRKSYEFAGVASQFYHQGRSFAARRAESFTFGRKLIFIAASLALPILLSFRVIKRVIEKQRRFGKLILSLPYLSILTSVWSFGELCGYLYGEGKSGSRWK